MSGNIYLVDERDNAVLLSEVKYESEDLFQRLIADYPAILAGEQISPEQPRKWILIKREMGVAEEIGGNDLYSLDHLFVDQDAIPTLVEVKRSSDTRLRREVVAQMMDYAANAAYWSTAQLRDTYESHCSGVPLSELGIPTDEADAYWDRVDSNLRAGKLRLMFVADEIPDSLRHIIEFMNEQMGNIEVLGLEIKQYRSDLDHRILVPRLIGRTMTAVQAKKKSGFTWTDETFLARVEASSGKVAGDVCRRLLDAFEDLGLDIAWGSGSTQAGLTPVYVKDGVRHRLAAIYAYTDKTKVEVPFGEWKVPLDAEATRLCYLRRFASELGVDFQDGSISGRPAFDCTILADECKFAAYIGIISDMLEEIKRA